MEIVVLYNFRLFPIYKCQQKYLNLKHDINRMVLLSLAVTGLFVIVFSGFILNYLSNKLDLLDKSYETAFIIASITGVIAFLLNLAVVRMVSVPVSLISVLIVLSVSLYLVKVMYNHIKWRTAVVMWLAWYLLLLLSSAFVGLVFALTSTVFL